MQPALSIISDAGQLAAVVLFIHLERPVPEALRNRLDEMIDSLDSQE